jgi:hypothetical protein
MVNVLIMDDGHPVEMHRIVKTDASVYEFPKPEEYHQPAPPAPLSPF